LIAGQIDLMFDQVSNALPQVRAGNIKAYASPPRRASPWRRRSRAWTRPACPDSTSHCGSDLGPQGHAEEIVAKLNAAAVQSLADPKVRQQLEALGQRSAARPADPRGAGGLPEGEIEKWWPIIKAANITAD